MPKPHSSNTVDAVIGSVCLIAGVALAMVVVAVRLDGLWNLPTSLVRRNPVLMLGFAVVLMLVGARLLWQTRQVMTTWAPTRPGRRFRTAVLYTKPGCHLCEQAAEILADYEPYLPTLESVDVTSDASLESRYSGCVPVVEIDGRRRFTGQINEVLLRRLIEGAPPQFDSPLAS